MDIRKRWKDIIYILLGLFLIGILMLRADVTDTLDALAGIDIPLLLLVLGLYFFNTFCKLMRWFGLLKSMGARRLGPVTLPIFLASLALNNSTPGKVGGEPVRALMLKEHTGNSATLGIASIFAEKSLDILTILAFSIFGLVYMVFTIGFEDVKGMVFAIGAGGLLIILVISLLMNRRFVNWVNSILERTSDRITGGKKDSKVHRMTLKIGDFIGRFYRSLSRIKKKPLDWNRCHHPHIFYLA